MKKKHPTIVCWVTIVFLFSASCCHIYIYIYIYITNLHFIFLECSLFWITTSHIGNSCPIGALSVQTYLMDHIHIQHDYCKLLFPQGFHPSTAMGGGSLCLGSCPFHCRCCLFRSTALMLALSSKCFCNNNACLLLVCAGKCWTRVWNWNGRLQRLGGG